eukprot:3049945-Prymnesium_polylepis.1
MASTLQECGTRLSHWHCATMATSTTAKIQPAEGTAAEKRPSAQFSEQDEPEQSERDRTLNRRKSRCATDGNNTMTDRLVRMMQSRVVDDVYQSTRVSTKR